MVVTSRRTPPAGAVWAATVRSYTPPRSPRVLMACTLRASSTAISSQRTSSSAQMVTAPILGSRRNYRGATPPTRRRLVAAAARRPHAEASSTPPPWMKGPTVQLRARLVELWDDAVLDADGYCKFDCVFFFLPNGGSCCVEPFWVDNCVAG